MTTHTTRLAFAAALLCLASPCLASLAAADPFDYPSPNAIPVVPEQGPAFELGMRYWGSDSKMHFDLNSSKHSTDLGNPTSILHYNDMNEQSGEMFFRAQGLQGTFAKGFLGGGVLNGGNLDDEDFTAGQVKFSDTYSQVRGDNSIYGTFDLGHAYNFGRFTASPLIGFNYWKEVMDAFGARCNPVDVSDGPCGPTGSIEVPFSTKVIENQANWASLRIGGELQWHLFNRLTLMGDAAYLPVAYVWNYDSHVLRSDLGPVPNIEDKGFGWGYQLEGQVRLDLTSRWTIGSGVRYWYASADGRSDFLNLFQVKSGLRDFTSERFGVFGDMSYKFF